MAAYSLSMFLFEIRLMIASVLVFQFLNKVGFVESMLKVLLPQVFEMYLVSLPTKINRAYFIDAYGSLAIEDLRICPPALQDDGRWRKPNIISVSKLVINWNIFEFIWVLVTSKFEITCLHSIDVHNLDVTIEAYTEKDGNSVFNAELIGKVEGKDLTKVKTTYSVADCVNLVKDQIVSSYQSTRSSFKPVSWINNTLSEALNYAFSPLRTPLSSRSQARTNDSRMKEGKESNFSTPGVSPKNFANSGDHLYSDDEEEGEEENENIKDDGCSPVDSVKKDAPVADSFLVFNHITIHSATIAFHRVFPIALRKLEKKPFKIGLMKFVIKGDNDEETTTLITEPYLNLNQFPLLESLFSPNPRDKDRGELKFILDDNADENSEFEENSEASSIDLTWRDVIDPINEGNSDMFDDSPIDTLEADSITNRHETKARCKSLMLIGGSLIQTCKLLLTAVHDFVVYIDYNMCYDNMLRGNIVDTFGGFLFGALFPTVIKNLKSNLAGHFSFVDDIVPLIADGLFSPSKKAKEAPHFQQPIDRAANIRGKQIKIKCDQNFNDLNCNSDDDIIVEHPLFPFPM